MIIDLTSTVYGYLGVIIFVLAYALVPLENNLHLRKSKPVLLAAGVIWLLVAMALADAVLPQSMLASMPHWRKCTAFTPTPSRWRKKPTACW